MYFFGHTVWSQQVFWHNLKWIHLWDQVCLFVYFKVSVLFYKWLQFLSLLIYLSLKHSSVSNALLRSGWQPRLVGVGAWECPARLQLIWIDVVAELCFWCWCTSPFLFIAESLGVIGRMAACPFPLFHPNVMSKENQTFKSSRFFLA